MHTTKVIDLGTSKTPVPTSSDERSLLAVAATLRKAGLEQNAAAIERAAAKSASPSNGRSKERR